MMNRLVLLVIGLIGGASVMAQQPVHWRHSIKKLDKTTFELHLVADIADGWHLYSQHQPDDAIAIPTTIEFKKNPMIVFSGKIDEKGDLHKQQVEELGIVQYSYENTVEFVQTVKLKAKIKANIKGSVKFEVCNSDRCVFPPDFEFSFDL